MTKDYSIYDAAHVFLTLEQHPPITQKLMDHLATFKTLHWTDQREHMVTWFLSQDSLGSGQYSRRRPNTSARVTYNRLLSAPGTLWIAEALGIDEARCLEALEVAKPKMDLRKKLRLMREILPWHDIAERIEAHLDPPAAWTLEDQAEELDELLFNNDA